MTWVDLVIKKNVLLSDKELQPTNSYEVMKCKKVERMQKQLI